MKRSGFLEKIIYWSNAIAALLLLLVFLISYLPPKSFPTLSLLTLAVFPLLLINLMFGLYWILRLKRRAIISFLVLALGYIMFGAYYKLGGGQDAGTDELSVMSFNVRLFNAYEEEPGEEVGGVVAEILQEHKPDIVCIQEYYREHPVDFSGYPHSFIHFKEEQILGHAIYSKYPILNSGGFDFEGTYNNSIYADILKDGDTLRIYNLHLQSMGILPSVEYLQDGDKNKLRKRMVEGFIKQQDQMELIREHMDSTTYPSIVSADLNNTPYSYIYRQMSQGYQDAYYDAGRGLGSTFNFDSYPMRIDFIFASEEFEVNSFKTIKRTFSDHYPILASMEIQSP